MRDVTPSEAGQYSCVLASKEDLLARAEIPEVVARLALVAPALAAE